MQEHLYTKGVVRIGIVAYAPKQRRIMDLEGLTRWVPSRTEGCYELDEEARERGMLA